MRINLLTTGLMRQNEREENRRRRRRRRRKSNYTSCLLWLVGWLVGARTSVHQLLQTQD
jgi:hypothetical protein